MKLEWKKNNIGKYIRTAVILTALLCLFTFALAFLGIADDQIGRASCRERVSAGV